MTTRSWDTFQLKSVPKFSASGEPVATLFIGELSERDIQYIRDGLNQIQEDNDSRNFMKCNGLSDAPKLNEMKDVFSSVLGDVFHAMDRTKVPVKHEAKKPFFVALRDAFLMWNKDKIKELEDNMKAAGMKEEELRNARYHSPAIYHGCVDRRVPPARELYIRVRGVYTVYGHLKDSASGKPLFNAAAWKKANNVLTEIYCRDFTPTRLAFNGTQCG